jgi:hypothetical protein
MKRSKFTESQIIFAHGFSTLPGINLYSKKLASLDENSAEKEVTNHLE